jgi:RNA polymerase sigma-70 factor, ECF subfamily
VAAEARRWTALAPFGRPALVNGVAGAVIGRPGRPFAVVGFTVANDRITALDFLVDPAKLARVTSGDLARRMPAIPVDIRDDQGVLAYPRRRTCGH